jgi:glycerol-3-phosphate dehydrogenase (NAD(P)+)
MERKVRRNSSDGQSIDTIPTLDRSMVKTISEVILEESVVVRVGCLAGPNLSKELAKVTLPLL